MSGWRLRANVYAADVGGDLVFLDASSNQYSCLARGDAGPIRRLLEGAEPAADQQELANELYCAGLIEPSTGMPVTAPFVLEQTAQSDLHDYAAADLPITMRSLWRLFSAAIETALILRKKSPAAWFERKHSGEDIAVTRACTLAAQFERLRPLIPRSGRCLAKSLLLLAYLRRHRFSPRLVFGVRTFPFEAHCWVEYEGVVLSDTVEHVRWYTPIAAA